MCFHVKLYFTNLNYYSTLFETILNNLGSNRGKIIFIFLLPSDFSQVTLVMTFQLEILSKDALSAMSFHKAGISRHKGCFGFLQMRA